MRLGDHIREIGHEEAELFGPPDGVDEKLRYGSASEPHQVLGSLTLAHASLTLTSATMRDYGVTLTAFSCTTCPFWL